MCLLRAVLGETACKHSHFLFI